MEEVLTIAKGFGPLKLEPSVLVKKPNIGMQSTITITPWIYQAKKVYWFIFNKATSNVFEFRITLFLPFQVDDDSKGGGISSFDSPLLVCVPCALHVSLILMLYWGGPGGKLICWPLEGQAAVIDEYNILYRKHQRKLLCGRLKGILKVFNKIKLSEKNRQEKII